MPIGVALILGAGSDVREERQEDEAQRVRVARASRAPKTLSALTRGEEVAQAAVFVLGRGRPRTTQGALGSFSAPGVTFRV